MKRTAIISGSLLLVLFAASIAESLVVNDERCDACGKTMDFDYAQPGLGATLALYRCPDRECDQRGQREFRSDGTINWTEW